MQTVKFQTFHLDQIKAVMNKKNVNYTVLSTQVVEHPRYGFLAERSEVAIEIPALNGWEFVAKKENIGCEFNLVTTPDSANESLTISHRTKPVSCSHCNTKRQRKISFLLKKEEGKVIEVGSTCLENYLEVSKEEIARIINGFEIIKLHSQSKEELEESGYDLPVRVLSLQEKGVAGTIYRVLSNTVYTKKCPENEYPTSLVLWTMLTMPFDDIASERLLTIISRVGKATAEDEVAGQKLLTEMTETLTARLQEGHEKMSEFDYKLAVLLQSHYIRQKDFAVFIGGLHAYLTRPPKATTVIPTMPVTGYQPGDKIEVDGVTFISHKTVNSSYGVSELYKFRGGKDGLVFSTFSDGDELKRAVPDSIGKLWGTVKKIDKYGVLLSRVVFNIQ